MLNKKLIGKVIDASREIRLWTTGIITVGVIAYINIPAVKKFVDEKIEDALDDRKIAYVKHNKTN